MTDMKKCPYCGEDVKLEAIKCKHCQTMLSEENNALVGAAAPLPSTGGYNMNTKVKIVTNKSLKASKAEEQLQSEITNLESMGCEIKDIKYVVHKDVAQFLIIYQ